MRGGDDDSSIDDTTLVLQAQRGELAAFELLVRRHMPRVAILARALLRNTLDAEDVVQDAFLRAYDNLAGFDPSRGGFGAWLSRIVTNRGYNALESRRRREMGLVDAAPDLVSNDERPDEAVERRELQERFAGALAELTDRQRAVVTLFEVEGLSTSEIAEHLRMTVATVRWHLHKARHELRRTLAMFANG